MRINSRLEKLEQAVCSWPAPGEYVEIELYGAPFRITRETLERIEKVYGSSDEHSGQS